jgi:predicted ATPase
MVSEKSTLIEAIAINAGFNPEGGSRNFNFSTMDGDFGYTDHVIPSQIYHLN